MIRRGVAVTAGVFTAAGVDVTVGVEVVVVPTGAGTRPGAGGVAVATAAVPEARVVVADTPARAVPLEAAGVVAAGEAVGVAPGAVALAAGVAGGLVGVDATDDVLPAARRDSVCAAASWSAASRARRDSSTRTTPSQEPASIASEVVATNRLTSVRRTMLIPHADIPRGSHVWNLGGALVSYRWRPPAAPVSRINDTVSHSVWSGV